MSSDQPCGNGGHCQSCTTWIPEQHLSQFDAIMFDCDGVLWHENEVIPGAPATLRKLQDMGKRLLFATNNSGKSRSAYAAKFKQLGFDITVTEDDIFTSSQAAAHYMSKLPVTSFDPSRQKAYTIGESGIGMEMNLQGIRCIESLRLFGGGHVSKSELSKMKLDPDIGAVVVGIDEQLTYTRVAYGVACLHQLKDPHGSRSDVSNRSCLFISTNQDSTLPTSGHTLPGAGSCVAMVATASGRQPINMGKPEPIMMQLAMEKFQLDPARLLMVGDRLDTDILFGTKSGVKTLFVHDTGVNNMADVENGNIKPTYILPNVTKMV